MILVHVRQIIHVTILDLHMGTMGAWGVRTLAVTPPGSAFAQLYNRVMNVLLVAVCHVADGRHSRQPTTTEAPLLHNVTHPAGGLVKRWSGKQANPCLPLSKPTIQRGTYVLPFVATTWLANRKSIGNKLSGTLRQVKHRHRVIRHDVAATGRSVIFIDSSKLESRAERQAFHPKTAGAVVARSRSSSTMDVRFTVRFLLANGEQSVQLCRGSATIVSLKRLLIRKKPHCFPENTVEQDIAMRLANARLFVLSDDDSLLSVLSRWPLFRESDDADVTPDIVVFPTADVNDQLKVQERKLSAGDPIVVAGPLQRRRKNSTKFKKQYCVIQSFTLFSFASESDYRHHRPAVQAYPLGSCQFADVPGIPFAFQIVVEMLCPGKSLVLKADDSAEYRMWMNALELITYRYAKCTLSRLTDQLESEFGLETEGIFRIASSAPATRVLRLGCERGVSPTDAHVDEHAICGLIKSVLRQLNPPLFTFKFYEDFTRIATQTSMGPTQMCERLSLLFGELPLHVIGLCEFLIAFLGRVSGHSMRNKMTPYNLGVVFGPNLLRPRSDNASESLRGSSIPDLVAFIIEHRDRIFPSRSFADFLVHKVNDVVVPVLPPPKAPCDPAPPCRPTPPAQVDDSVPGGASPGALEVPPQAPEERTEDEEQLPPPLPTDDEAESVSDVVPLRRPTICVSDGAETTEFDTDVEETAEEECLDAVETGSVSSLSPSPDMPSPMHNHASEAQPPVDDNELGDMFSMERLCKEMQGISADWDEHLAELAKSVAETMARVQTTGPVDPMVLAHLTRCIEVEREWRAKAEQNGALMLRLLARVEQDENI